jgi:glycosyltransferase involved in cell wall biosynthesis
VEADAVMSHASFVEHYRPPGVDPLAPRPSPCRPRRGEARLRAAVGRARRTLRGRRLAYVDSHFPWRRSGFRYADALALHELRPDTVFFSMYETSDPFPAEVLPLAQFPKVAPALGITDVYGIFLDFTGGLLGLWNGEPGRPGPTDGLDMSSVLRRSGIGLHAVLAQGGGFVPTEEGFERASRLVAAADQVMSWDPLVLERMPGVVPIDPAVIDTRLFALTPRDMASRPLRLLIAADDRPRKGVGVTLDAMRLLAGAPVELHVVGPHGRRRAEVDDERIVFHGWMEPHELRDLHRRCHVFMSPVTAETPHDLEGDGGVVDGFPTGAAAEAMSSGLLLVTSNPLADRRLLRAGHDHLEIEADAEAVSTAVRWVLDHPVAAATIASAGAARVRERMEARVGARHRLALMGMAPAGGV